MVRRSIPRTYNNYLSLARFSVAALFLGTLTFVIIPKTWAEYNKKEKQEPQVIKKEFTLFSDKRNCSELYSCLLIQNDCEELKKKMPECLEK